MYIDSEKIIGDLIYFLLGLLIMPLVFMLIWNQVITSVCGFQTLTFAQAFFISIGVRAINGTVGIKRKLDK